MRIVGGELGGRRFNPPANLQARPTTDVAKESLFNILNNQIDFEEITVLDMFGGTGSISFEFASRGAKNIITLEKNRINYQFIVKAMNELSIQNMDVIIGDSFKYAEKTSAQYDIIFADPPYDDPKLAEIPDLIFKQHLLKEGGILILEHSKKNQFDQHPHFNDHRNYGHVNFSFFK